MPDKKKVIKGLECCLKEPDDLCSNPCEYCPYEGFGCIDTMKMEALALLKEQEAIAPTWSRGRPYCGSCGLRIRGGKYCSECGAAIAWEGR